MKKLSLVGGIIAFLLITGIVGCKKEAQQLGFGLQPDSDLIRVFNTDSVDIVSFSERIDSISSGNAPTSLFGGLKDPVFGQTTAAFSVNFRISKSAHSWGTGPVFDSLVLLLSYDDIYGDTASAQTMRVYELADRMYADTLYYSNSVINYSTT